SKLVHLTYNVNNTPDAEGWITLSGWAGGRLVFELKVRANDDDADSSTNIGDFEFRLYDQLDHDWGQGQNLDLHDHVSGADVDALPFGDILKAYDNDGDGQFLGGAFVIEVKDDRPRLVNGARERRTVDEDDIDTIFSQGTKADDGPGDGSYTGFPWIENGDSPSYLEGSANISGSLAHIVSVGADE